LIVFAVFRKIAGATNQVSYLKNVAIDWRDNWYDCFPRTQWTRPFLDCLYSVRKENPLANQESDAFRMCIMVTDGAPWKDAYPDGNDSPKYSNMKWVNTKKRNFYYTSFFFFFNSCFQLALFTYSPSISKNTLITSSFFLTYINYIWNFFLLHTLFFSCNEIILFFCYYY